MSCSLSLDVSKSKALEALANDCGNNGNKLAQYYNLVVKEQLADGTLVPTAEFRKWYMDNFHTNVNLNTPQYKVMKARIVRFYEEKTGSIVHNTRSTHLSELLSTYGYTSYSARSLCKSVFCGIVAQKQAQVNRQRLLNPTLYAQLQQAFKDKGERNFYLNEVIKIFNKELANRIAAKTGEDIKTVVNRIQTEKRNYIDAALGGENMSTQDKNLVAFVSELMTNPKAVILELSRDSRLGSMRYIETDSQFGDTEQQRAANAAADLNNRNTEGDEGVNTEADDYEVWTFDHSGTYTSAFMHVDENIRSYFNGLQRLNSTKPLPNGKPDFDLNNDLGMPDTMSAKECISVMYHYGDYTKGIKGMIDSINKIADTLPGFAAFSEFAKALSSDLDFANSVYRVFAKAKVQKSQIRTEDGNSKSVISNQRTDTRSAFIFDLRNAVRSTCVSNDPTFELSNIKEFEDDYDTKVKDKINKDRNGIERKEAVAALTKLIKVYYPNVDDEAIEIFVNCHKINDEVNPYNNIQSLIGILKDTITASKQSKRNYDALREEARKAKQEDRAEIWAKPYMSEAQVKAANALADKLLPYSLVSVDTNSINVEGNQSSDVINNSMLTDFLTILKDEVALDTYMRSKMKFSEYKYSNILVEHDENKGLFRYNENGELEITEYAPDLLKLSLFDGARNNDNNKQTLYSGMSDIDYIKTLWTTFFEVYDDQNKQDDNVGGYFMRTPADAPRNFALYSQRYKVVDKGGNLFKAETTEAGKAEKAKMEEHTKGRRVSSVTNAVNESAIRVYDVEDAVKHITAEDGKVDVRLPKYIFKNRKIKDGVKVVLKFKQGSKNNNDNKNIYLIEGVIQDGHLTNGTLVGVYNNNYSDELNGALKNYVETQLERSGYKTYTINTNHPIYKQLKNIFTQEILNAAVALDKFFVTDRSGYVERYNADEATTEKVTEGDIKWKSGVSQNGNEVQGAFENYHHKKGVIVEKGKNGKDRLVGNVFHSDRFIAFDEKTGQYRNFGEEIINEAFDFLYGAASGKHIHMVKDAKDNVIDVEFTPEQEAVINTKLQEYINTFVADSYSRLLKYENVISLNHDKVAEFVLNYQIMYNNFNDLFEGDTKFYKDVTNLYKRAKENQGSGVLFGISNPQTTYNGIRGEVPSALDGVVFGNGTEGHKLQVKMFDKFKAITIVNTKKASDSVDVLRKKLTEDMKMSKEDVDALLKPFEEDTTVNDAQSYITFEEWIRRITARGQLGKYKPLIDKIVNGEELNGAELTEFVQVQKNFYYNQDVIEDGNIHHPNQIKNAEFVLIPQLIKGRQLEIVEKLMKKYGIDQLNTLETSKAGNSDVLEIFDKNTGDVKEDIVKEMESFNNPVSEFGKKATAATKLMSYDNLRTQQETPQHLNAENKAGLQIVKKVFDNIPEGHPCYDYKQTFFDVYATNIQESNRLLMEELGVELDENGNLVLEENENGVVTIKGFNQEVFYKKLEKELMRLGMDSNALDYVTFDENGIAPIMPNYLTYRAKKLENIAQAVFNNIITRQTLPGFHAAQISNVGWKSINKDSKVLYGENLKYHVGKDGKYADYVEIMLPASAFGFKRTNPDGSVKTKEDLLKELQAAGLDEILGYRIPTEGKHSICKMKVVDFIDDSYGSTIVVPNEWVTQTGSDFDIDSVYGIQPHTYIDADGKIKKTEYKNAEDFDEYDYYRYVRSHTKKKHTGVSKEGFARILESAKQETKKELKEQQQNRNEIYKELESSAYKYLDKSTKKSIKLLHEKLDELKGTDKKENYISQLQNTIDLLNNRKESFAKEYNEDEIDNIDAYISVLNEILEDITKDNTETYTTIKSAKITEELDKIKKQQFDEYSNDAKEAGLMSYEEYLGAVAENTAKYNSKKARDNKIVECMQKIIESDTSLIENLSRSNFDDVIKARDEMSKKLVKGRGDTRSAYNVLDQAQFAYDSVSAIQLKGISVIHDSFCSVCNTVQPVVNKGSIEIVYPTDIISEKEAIDRFGRNNVKPVRDGFIKITFDKYGWSYDNKNVVGKVLTEYTSQTTAHILDVVKEGFIPNVNTLTFPVFKMFANLGIDYRTACAFIMQPGIARIINVANKSNSVFLSSYSNPVEEAIRSIARELGFNISDYDKAQDVVKLIAKQYGDKFHNIFKNSIKLEYKPKADSNVIINPDFYANKMSLNPETEEARLFDLGVILQYANLAKKANEIDAIIRVSNPDKFGAKQTLYATQKVIDDLRELAEAETSILTTQEGVNFVNAIYPGIENGIEEFIKADNIKDSKYKSLCAFLKYATLASYIVNKNLFVTYSDDVVNFIRNFSNRLHKPLTEEQVNQFKNYIISSICNSCDAITSPINFLIEEQGDKKIGFEKLEVNEEDKETDSKYFYYNEKVRIFGYNLTPVVDFVPNNIYEPTQEEVTEFSKLSPAQKVLWIQQNLPDSGVFKYVQANLFTERTGNKQYIGRHTLRFNADKADIEDIYTMFELAFSSTNPFMALAAYDIVKYAFMVDGYNMKRNSVSSMIPNSVLYNDFGIFGTGFIQELESKVKYLPYILYEENSSQKLKDDFVKSQDLDNIRTAYVKNDDITVQPSGIAIVSDEDIIEKYGLGEVNEEYGVIAYDYIKLNIGGNVSLYKINQQSDVLYLYPLNKLNDGEYSDDQIGFSINPANNKYKSQTYYDLLINKTEETLSDVVIAEQILGKEEAHDSIGTTQIGKVLKEVSKNVIAKDYNAPNFDYIFPKEPVDVDFENPPANLVGTIDKIKKDIQKEFGKENRPVVIVRKYDGIAKGHYIKVAGRDYGWTNKPIIITDEQGNKQLENFDIYRISSKFYKAHIGRYLGEGYNRTIRPEDEKYKDIIEAMRSTNISNVPNFADFYAIIPSNLGKTKQTTKVDNKTETEDSEVLQPMLSTTTEYTATKMYKTIEKASKNGENEFAETALKELNAKGVTRDNLESHQMEILSSAAKYVINRKIKLIHDFNHFVNNPEGEGYLSIIDSRVFDLMKNNEELRNKYLKLILDSEFLIKQFGSIETLNLSAENHEAKVNYQKINDAIRELRENYLQKIGKELFAEKYLTTLSTNPLIENNLIEIFNSFYSTNSLSAAFNDLQETNNPIIQLVAKEVTADLFAKEKEAQRVVRNFKKFMNDVYRKAEANGHTINFDNIIDESGRFIQPYVEQFVEDGTALYNKVKELKDKYTKEYTNDVEEQANYIEYLKAKLEYDKWKAAHLNQAIVDDYYEQRIALEEDMIEHYPTIYAVYQYNLARRYEILENVNDDGSLDPYYEAQLEEIDKVLADLTSYAKYDPLTESIIEKESFSPSIGGVTTSGKSVEKIIYSYESAAALEDFIKQKSMLNSEYFDYDTDFGFEEELNRNLRIIESFEVRDSHGNLTTPMDVLLENEEYRKAKEWIAVNAKYKIEADTEEGNALIDSINKALKTLRKKGSKAVLGHIVKKYKAKDNKGVIDAREFTEEDIKQIKEEQARDLNYHEGEPYDDRTLLNSAGINHTIYTLAFYKALRSDGRLNPEYIERIAEINKLLQPYYDNTTNTIDFTLIPNTKEGRDIYEKLEKLYDALFEDEYAEDDEERLKHKLGSTNGKLIKFFIEKNIDFVINEDEFNKQELLAKTKGDMYYESWKKANLMVIDGEAVPNPYIYSYMKPKPEVEDKYIDKEKTAALKLLDETQTTVPTEYYYQKIKEVKALGKDAYNKWFNENHIYNPYTHKLEPLRCWTTTQYKDDIKGIIGVWKPNWNRTTRVIKEDKVNVNHKEKVHFSQNYKEGSGYDNAEYGKANEYELEVKEEFQRLLKSLVKTQRGKSYINHGYLPSEEKLIKDAKYYLKEVGAIAGIAAGYDGEADFKDNINYYTDEIRQMSMLHLLDQRTSKQTDLEEPVKRSDESDEDFVKRVKEYEKVIADLKKENEERHKAALNRDWQSIMEKFIMEASKYNAIQDNKYMLYYGRSILEDMGVNQRKYKFYGDYKTEDGEIVREKDNKLIEQYETWARRILYQQWRHRNGFLTKAASYLQTLTSAQYMMLNIRGGIANVTVGKGQIAMERYAKEYFNTAEFAQGEALWLGAVPSMFADMYKETASTTANAAIKFFEVVDENGVLYRVGEANDPTARGFRFVKDFFYSPNGMGENYMQNSALFACMYSNRLFEVLDESTGKKKLVFKTEAEAIRDCHELALKSVLTEEQRAKYDEFIRNIKSDENLMRKYAHYRRNTVTVFAKEYLSKEQQKEFIAAKKQLETKTKEEFHNDEIHPTIWSQVCLIDDGYMGFKKDSLLEQYDVISESNTVSDSYKLLGQFKRRVISVNHKIHGVYDKLGAGAIESKLGGALLTQYHKHIPMGIQKRFKREGGYNEERGTIEKGFYISLLDFLAMPFQEQKRKLNLSDKEVTALESIQSIFKGFLGIFTDASINWNLLENYEKANILRAVGELRSVLIALFVAIALKGFADDDDKDKIWYNLALYEADRLASESFQFNPAGIVLSKGSDIKKLWSTPIAAQTGIEDVIKSMGLLTDMIMEGDDYDPYYHNGQYAGEHKLSVYVQRRIPIWRGIKSGFIDIKDSNKYYKMGDNMLGIIPVDKIAEEIKR